MSSMIHPQREAYSAKVLVRLRIGECTLDVAQVGDGFCILRDHRPYGPTDAELDIIVDGSTVTQTIFLFNGISDDLRRVSFI